MADTGLAGAAGRSPEDDRRRQDEEHRERYREVLEEYRTILPGVQVLFAFLLTAPFSPRFERLDEVGRNLFMLAIVSTAVSIVLLLSPTAYHRIAPRAGREKRLRVATRAAVGGLATVATAVVTAIFVVTRFVYDNDVAALLAGLIAGLALVLWFAIPIVRRFRG